jgi:hypothetical protein
MDERFLAVRRKRIDGDWPGYAQELESILRDRLGSLSEEARQEALSDHENVLAEIQNAIQRMKFAGYCPSAEEADVLGQKVEQMARQIRDRRPRGG